MDDAIQTQKEIHTKGVQQLQLLSRLSVKIASTSDATGVLQEVVEAAGELISARYAALGVFDSSSGHISHFFTYGLSSEERQRIGNLPEGLGLLGRLQRVQEPVRLADLSKDAHSVGFPANHPAMNSFLGVPVRYGGEGLGNLYLTEKIGSDEFTEEDEELLVLFAAQAAVAIYNARLQQQLREQSHESERLAQEAQAKWAELEAMVDISPVGVFVFNADGRVALINREAQRILNLTRQPDDTIERFLEAAVRKRPDGSVYEPEDIPILRALRRGELVRAEEMRFEFADGHSLPAMVSAVPLKDSEGRITAAIAVIQDITPIEELERLRSEFLGIVSHELRTPLTAIKGAAATVLGSRRPFDAAESLELFEIVDEQADRLRDMVDNLLDMTRIEAGTLSVNPETVDLMSVIGEAKTAFLRSSGYQDLEVDAPTEVPQINADRRRVLQAFANLLGNAAKFSGGAPISISVDRNPTNVTVHVTDQGRGIAPEKLSYLFRKFSQIHEEGGRKIEGTGLGLAICKGIVEAHGGRIWADSEGIGRGTTFSFTLPIYAPESSGPQIDLADRSQHLGRVSRHGEGTRVLVVDDEVRIQRFLDRSLSEAGYKPILTGDSAQVIPLVEEQEPDVVLLDLHLAGASGFELLQRIREFSGVPVIMLTASDSSEDTVRALKLGADDYMTKPFSTSELLARIEATLRRRALHDVVESHAPFVLEQLRIDFARRAVSIGGVPVSLTATEYKILYELASNPGRVLTHDQLLQRVWGPEYAGEVSLLRSFIRNIRHKLGEDAQRPRYILTERQVGYRIAAAPNS